jgi:biopolymer transport protein ExbD/biopolymer transport protein TolR
MMAPMLTKTLPIDLPKVAAGTAEPRDRAVSISFHAHGQFAIDGREVTADHIEPLVKRIAMHNKTEVNCARTRASHLASLRH